MAQVPQPQVQFQYVDLPDVSETFADFVQRIQFDGQTLRIEFGVSRLDDQRSPGRKGHGQTISGVPAGAVARRRGRPDEQDAADHRGAHQGGRAAIGRTGEARAKAELTRRALHRTLRYSSSYDGGTTFQSSPSVVTARFWSMCAPVISHNAMKPLSCRMRISLRPSPL